jgi:hypothetical protein
VEATIKNLERLELSDCSTVGWDKEHIPGFLELGYMANSLTYLDLSYSSLTKQHLDSLFDGYLLSDFCILQTLNLSGTEQLK